MAERPLAAGLVGCGNIAARHAQVLSELPETDLAAVVDVDPARAKAFAERFGARVEPDVAALARSRDIDLVVIAVPADRHAEVGLVCVEAGKPVLCEKPIDAEPARGRALARAAAERGVALSVVSQNRFFDDVLWLRETLAAGRLGRPVLLEVASVWRRDQAYYDGAPGRGRHVRAEGGVLLNQAVHYIDLMLWLLGPVASLSSHLGTLTHEIAVEDTAALSLEFTSGALGSVIATTSTLGEPERIELRCQRGSVTLAGGVATRFECEPGLELAPPPGLSTPRPPAPDKLEPFRRQHRDFAAAVREKREPTVRAAEALAVLELIHAAYRAQESGARVRIDAG